MKTKNVSSCLKTWKSAFTTWGGFSKRWRKASHFIEKLDKDWDNLCWSWWILQAVLGWASGGSTGTILTLPGSTREITLPLSWTAHLVRDGWTSCLSRLTQLDLDCYSLDQQTDKCYFPYPRSSSSVFSLSHGQFVAVLWQSSISQSPRCSCSLSWLPQASCL